MHAKLESNIWKYALILITNKRVFVAIIGSYYLTIPDVTPWWVGTFMLIGSLSSFIFEIPSGYISDKIGHKNGLVLSGVLLVLSSLSLLFADTIFLAALGTALWSVGFAFHSGTGSAFLGSYAFMGSGVFSRKLRLFLLKAALTRCFCRYFTYEPHKATYSTLQALILRKQYKKLLPPQIWVRTHKCV